MNKIIRCIFLILGVVLLCGCSRKDDILYRELTMAQLDGGSFRTDGGKTFQVVEQYSDLDLSGTGRYLILCDVLRSDRRSASDIYDVRLIDYFSVLVKDVCTAATLPSEDAAADDPVAVVRAWSAGGYLNLRVAVEALPESKVQHRVNLVYDAARSHADTLFFDLRHNAQGEVPTEETGHKYVLSMGYCSFPVSDLLPASGRAPVLTVRGNWYVSEDPGVTKPWQISVR